MKKIVVNLLTIILLISGCSTPPQEKNNMASSSCPELTGLFQCSAEVEDGKETFPKHLSQISYSDNENGVRTYKWSVEFTVDNQMKKTVEKIIADGVEHKEDSEMGKGLVYTASCKGKKLIMNITFDNGKKIRNTFSRSNNVLYKIKSKEGIVSKQSCNPAKLPSSI